MSKMIQAIHSLRAALTPFDQYLLKKIKEVKPYQRDPIQTMIENSASTTRKLDKLSRIVGEHKNKPEMQHQLAEKVYSKLIEYIARIQEAITGCILREKNNNNLPDYIFLCNLTVRIDQILLKPDDFFFILPKKHWLTIEQTALNIADNTPAYDNPHHNKTVLFRALRCSNYKVTSTTQQIELAKNEQMDEKEWRKKTLEEIKEQNKQENNKLSAKL